MLTGNRYTEAAEWAQKAQICFNECIQSLTPHWGLLKRDELQDGEDLKQTGLLQAVQLYKLMYGGKVLQMGITRAYPPSVLPSPRTLSPWALSVHTSFAVVWLAGASVVTQS